MEARPRARLPYAVCKHRAANPLTSRPAARHNHGSYRRTRATMDIAQWEFAYVPTTGVRRAHETPIVLATEASLEGFGRLVDDPKTFPIEIVRWPPQGWRPS